MPDTLITIKQDDAQTGFTTVMPLPVVIGATIPPNYTASGVIFYDSYNSSFAALTRQSYLVARPPSFSQMVDKFYESSDYLDTELIKLISDNLHDLF